MRFDSAIALGLVFATTPGSASDARLETSEDPRFEAALEYAKQNPHTLGTCRDYGENDRTALLRKMDLASKYTWLEKIEELQNSGFREVYHLRLDKRDALVKRLGSAVEAEKLFAVVAECAAKICLNAIGVSASSIDGMGLPEILDTARKVLSGDGKLGSDCKSPLTPMELEMLRFWNPSSSLKGAFRSIRRGAKTVGRTLRILRKRVTDEDLDDLIAFANGLPYLVDTCDSETDDSRQHKIRSMDEESQQKLIKLMRNLQSGKVYGPRNIRMDSRFEIGTQSGDKRAMDKFFEKAARCAAEKCMWVHHFQIPGSVEMSTWDLINTLRTKGTSCFNICSDTGPDCSVLSGLEREYLDEWYPIGLARKIARPIRTAFRAVAEPLVALWAIGQSSPG